MKNEIGFTSFRDRAREQLNKAMMGRKLRQKNRSAAGVISFEVGRAKDISTDILASLGR